MIATVLATALAISCGGDPAPSPCGVQGGTQTCVCPDTRIGAQSCLANGSWSVCECSSTDPRCDGVTCHNGGRCVIAGEAPACECPRGVAGSLCAATCTGHALTLEACTNVGRQGDWSAPGVTSCLTSQRFAFKPPQGQVPELALADRLIRASPPIGEPARAMRDDDGDGTFEVTVLLPGGTEWLYAYVINAEFVVDELAPIDPENDLNIVTTRACAAPLPVSNACTNLLGEGRVDLSCKRPDTPGCGAPRSGCPDGCIEDAWFGVVLNTRRVVSELRFRADWWQKRPATWELWVGDEPGMTPGAGARLVASGPGRAAPWECVSGEPCDDPSVPDACCPDGRSSPQRVDADAHIAKWDIHPVPETEGDYYFLRVTSTGEPGELLLEDIALEGHDCFGAGRPIPLPACKEGLAGEAAGCGANEWCAPGAGQGLAEPGCVTVGTAGLGELCAEFLCADLPDAPCPTEAACAAGQRCHRNHGGPALCATPCDTSRGDAACGVGFECVATTDGDATLTLGVCERPTCDEPFATGVCPTGTWCSPQQPRCLDAGSAGEREACRLDSDCEPGTRCWDRTCRRFCGDATAYPGARACDVEQVCVRFRVEDSLGLCFRLCDFDNGPPCPAGSYCLPGEFANGFEACRDTPSSWPGDQGFAPEAPCPEFGTPCAPLGLCADRGEGPFCLPLCRPAAEGDADCPQGWSGGCQDTGAGVGVCHR